MEIKILNPELQKLDDDIFNANKIYGMALNSLNSLPNIYAANEFRILVEKLKLRLNSIIPQNEFEKLLIENSLYNLDSQISYLEYFTKGDKLNITSLIENVLGKGAIDIVKNNCKNFDYKSFWEYYLSYQEYTYRQIPSDDESLREKFKSILMDLKKDIIEYGIAHFNFPKDYDFECVLGQPYSQKTFFHPTTRRMEISPVSFFVFKDKDEIKINVCSIIYSMFHEIIGHGRHEVNSRFLPMTLTDNSINTSVPPLHIHSEGIAQITNLESIKFMKKYKEKYLIEEDYIRQMELSMVVDYSSSLWIYYQYLYLKSLEDKTLDIEKEYLELTNNRGLYIINTISTNSPLSCVKNSSYPVGINYIKKILEDLKNELGDEVFEKNHSLINQAISVGLWNFRVLPRFIHLYLENNGIKFNK